MFLICCRSVKGDVVCSKGKYLAMCVRDAEGLVAIATGAKRSAEQPDPSVAMGTPHRKAWRQWEIDTNRKIENGKKQWDQKIQTFLTSKQDWQNDIKQAALEQSLEKMLGATGSQLAV